MVLSGPKVKRLNKEMVTQVLLDNFDFSPELICEIVECIWRSGDAVEQGAQADKCPNCRGAGIIPTGMGATATCIHCFGSGFCR